MDSGGPSSFRSDRHRRGLDVAVWVLVLAGLIGIAAAVAWILSNTSFEIREITYEDDSVDFELIPPAQGPRPVPVAPPPAHASAARDVDADGVAPPRWARQPAPVFPERAAGRGIERGEVALLCNATASGEVGFCTVLRESPAGEGFAEAAVASMRQARVMPRSSDGIATDSRIRFTILFRLETER